MAAVHGLVKVVKIVNGELVIDRVGIDPSEALDQMQGFRPIRES